MNFGILLVQRLVDSFGPVIMAAFAAAGHHGGLPDGGTQGDSPDAGTFWGRMKRAERGMLPDCSPWTEEIALPSPAPPPAARSRCP